MLFRYRPEKPILETLRFLTDVLPHKDGSEQRIALRYSPRQEFELIILVEDGLERQVIENMLFGDQSEVFQLPVWTDASALSSAATAAATTINLDTTLSDFRTGEGVLLLLPDDETYEVTDDVTTVNSGSLVLNSGIANNWPAGTEVYPLRDCQITIPPRNVRYQNSLTRYTIRFQVLDNDVDLSSGITGFDVIGFGDDTAKYLLDGPNYIDGQLTEASDRQVQVLDNNTGKFSSISYWDRSRRSTNKAFCVRTREDLWQIRKLLHYLKGRQVSFLLPTFASFDMTPAGDATSAAVTLQIVNTGFTAHNAIGRNSRKYIRITKTDGTTVDKQVASVAELSSTVEEITVTVAWASTIAQADIAKITIFEKVRIDNDDIVIEHTSLIGDAKVSFPVKAVNE